MHFHTFYIGSKPKIEHTIYNIIFKTQGDLVRYLIYAEILHKCISHESNYGSYRLYNIYFKDNNIDLYLKYSKEHHIYTIIKVFDIKMCEYSEKQYKIIEKHSILL